MRLSGRRPAGMMGAPVPRHLSAVLAAAALALVAAGSAPAPPPPPTARRAASPTGATSSTRSSCPSGARDGAPVPPRGLVEDRRRLLTTAGRTGSGSAGQRAALPAAAALPQGADRLADALRLPRASSGDRPAVGRRRTRCGRRRNALSAQARRSADPTADPTAYTRRLSLLDPGYRRAALREIRRIVPTVRDRPTSTTTPAATSRSRCCPAARRGARRSAGGWRATSGGPPAAPLPDPAARPSTSLARGAALAGLVALLGRPLLRDEGGAGPPHPPARPRRGGQPQRLRLHRRLHPLGLHAPGRRSPTSSRPTPT